MSMSSRMTAMLEAFDYQMPDFNFDLSNYDSLLPKDVKDHFDKLFSDSRKWFETLDFQVGRTLAEAGASPKHPVMLMPGVISTGLESWTTSEDEASYFRKRLWGSATMIRNVLFDKEKWIKHLSLDTVTGLDPPGVRVRAAKGLDAASYFAAGYWIWSKIIQNLAAVGYDINMIYLASYDWRLSMSNLEERDHFFTQVKNQIELNSLVYNEKTVICAHSMGSTVALYFFKWIENEVGAQWIDEHIEGLVNIAGTMFGVPKAMAALLTGEMRDTVQVPPLLSYLLERFFSSHERAALFRSWAGSASMIIKGGDAVWGDENGAPDDRPDAEASQAYIYEYAARGNVSEDAKITEKSQSVQSQKFTADQAIPWLMENSPTDFQKMIATNYSNGIERDPHQIRRNNKDPTKWTNPLEVALPYAPNMKIYCIYGYGKPTERSYWMRHGPYAYSDHAAGVGSNETEDLDDPHLSNQSSVFPKVPTSRIDSRITFQNAAPKVNSGCRIGEGDGTVSLLSLGSMCVHGWKLPRYNPARIPVITHEILHQPDEMDLRGGPKTGDHVDILGAHDLNEALVKVAVGLGHEINETIHSPIRDYAAKIRWDADHSALRAAYLQLARRVSAHLIKQYHPDKATHPDTQDKIRSINAAYETLSDASLRFAYDARRKAYVASGYARKGPRISDTIDIDAFDVQQDRDEIQLTYPCRCGQQYVVGASEMATKMDAEATHSFDVQCTGCSEIVRVIYSNQD
ncbi:phospholipid:diacylglycerol acyltransferase [Malassezia psittaci]|uniref:Diphthamide biosynthesis protein 4 n=1 Tax=Malassezia psittaci TaxID=1821823 RepID=A0AAF0JFI1_9BASI|nr:phospholipid:diacylglycerol acyltransferase [Malassezia psittaci]